MLLPEPEIVLVADDEKDRVATEERMDRRPGRGGGEEGGAERQQTRGRKKAQGRSRGRQFIEQVGAIPHRHAVVARGRELGIGTRHRGRRDDEAGPVHRVRPVAHPRLDSQVGKGIQGAARLDVGSGDDMTLLGEELGQPAHAGSAHADDVYPRGVFRAQPQHPGIALGGGRQIAPAK